MGAGERKKGACGMVYLAITAAIFTLDFFLKKYIDKKYARKENIHVSVEKSA